MAKVLHPLMDPWEKFPIVCLAESLFFHLDELYLYQTIVSIVLLYLVNKQKILRIVVETNE